LAEAEGPQEPCRRGEKIILNTNSYYVPVVECRRDTTLGEEHMKRFFLLFISFFVLVLSSGLFADQSITVPAAAVTQAPAFNYNAGDISWMLISSALVLLMTPGLAFFYGGLVRKKNVLGILMQCMISIAVISLQWILWGYSLSFAPGNGFIGGFKYLCLNNVGMEPCPFAPNIPHQLFMIFQMMFAVITPALIIGAFAERMKFTAYIIFSLLWATLVYNPICHWVWGGGWMSRMGVMDFAGGIVVHISAGFAALVTAIVIGKRRNHTAVPTPHNLPFTVLGAGLLWFGWFGFNAGSALGANGVAISTFLSTNTAAAAAAITWAIIEWSTIGKPTMLGTATGAIAGLATVTPASGFIGVMPAIAVGASASIICYLAVSIIKPKFNYDDTLDAFGVHGIGGLWGTLLTGLFASKLINPAGTNGLFFGNTKQFLIQTTGAFAAVAYTVIATFLIIKLVDMTIGIRVSDKKEVLGLDVSEHDERAYTLID
jgi:Amt family ammonium transporter